MDFKKILVCGGRDYGHAPGQFKDWPKVKQDEYYNVQATLERLACCISFDYVPDDNWLPGDIWIIAGGANGADAAAYDWAVTNWCRVTEYPADWKRHGRRAGPMRNTRMLDENPTIELVVAFPGGPGTADMVRQARARNICVWEIDD